MILGSSDNDSAGYAFDDGVEEGEPDAVMIDDEWRVHLLSKVD